MLCLVTQLLQFYFLLQRCYNVMLQRCCNFIFGYRNAAVLFLVSEVLKF